jgi:nucleoside 2-deoxyribosyltransferase
MKKIYLAGSCSKEERGRMEEIAAALREKGYEVYCPFELKIPNAWDYPQETWARKVFDADVAAIDDCDFMVMISKGRMSSAGTNWEQGYAYAKGKPVFVFQWAHCDTSLMTYCGCKRFLNLRDFIGATTYIAEFPYEAYINRKDRGYNPCHTVLT